MDTVYEFYYCLQLYLQTRNDKYSQNRKKQSKNLTLNSDVEPWSTRRTAILCKYTTSEKLSIVSNFLSGGEKRKIIFNG